MFVTTIMPSFLFTILIETHICTISYASISMIRLMIINVNKFAQIQMLILCLICTDSSTFVAFLI